MANHLDTLTHEQLRHKRKILIDEVVKPDCSSNRIDEIKRILAKIDRRLKKKDIAKEQV